MRVLVTGAGGFIGSKVVERLADHEVIAQDISPDGLPQLPHVTPVIGDLRQTKTLTAACGHGCDAVVHLATVPGGAAEEKPDAARDVNVDATMALADIASRANRATRFVFASSIAALGHPLPGAVDDDTPLAPVMLYGAHKAMMEQWLATLCRRGDLDALSLRLSGVVARPGRPSGMKSAFLSDVFHALIAGESFVMPVSADATCWLTSVDRVAQNITHALRANLSQAPANRAVTLPSRRVRMGDLVAEISEQTDRPSGLVSYASNPALEAAFGSYPPLATPAADRLGFAHDGDLFLLVERAIAALNKKNQRLEEDNYGAR